MLADTPSAAACEVRYCELIAHAMTFVDELNDFLLPSFRSAEIGLPSGGLELTRLTFDDDVVADNEWSPDATRIVHRSTPNDFPREPASIRRLTFDDCAP